MVVVDVEQVVVRGRRGEGGSDFDQSPCPSRKLKLYCFAVVLCLPVPAQNLALRTQDVP